MIEYDPDNSKTIKIDATTRFLIPQLEQLRKSSDDSKKTN